VPDNPYVFVTGCTRSGTTLLQRMLDSHPQLAVSNDTHVVPRTVMRSNPDPQLPLTDDLVEQVVRFERFDHFGVDPETARGLAATADTFVDFVRALLEEFARSRGKPYAGEKDPEYVRGLPLLHRLFPSARSVQIVRDGRDVTLSTLDWVTPKRFLGRMALWREEPVATCALYWRRQVAEGQRGRHEVGADRCLEIRYEELVRAPEVVMRSIADFLDLRFDPAMLEFHKERTRHDPRLSSKDRWLRPTAGLRDWRVGLSPRDLELFDVLAGDVLVSLGYPLVTDAACVSPEVTAVAERCRAWWEANIEHGSNS
jgi:hypothetical protein